MNEEKTQENEAEQVEKTHAEDTTSTAQQDEVQNANPSAEDSKEQAADQDETGTAAPNEEVTPEEQSASQVEVNPETAADPEHTDNTNNDKDAETKENEQHKEEEEKEQLQPEPQNKDEEVNDNETPQEDVQTKVEVKQESDAKLDTESNDATTTEEADKESETETNTNEEQTVGEKEKAAAEWERIARCEKLSHLLSEAKDEGSDLRSHSYHLLKQVIEVIEKNNHSLGLDMEVPSTMNLLSNSSNMESKQNELYESMLKEVEYLHMEYSNKQTKYNERISTLNERVIEHDENAINLKNTYKNFKRKMCKNVNKKSAHSCKIETKWILQTEEEEEAIDEEIEQERLKNIHYNMSVNKLSQKLKEKDKLSDGLHLIDFEQLKIENQTLNEKIEERNDELYKLKKKITNTVQILAHIKEKLQFINKINERLMGKQKRLDDLVNTKRDTLNELKKARDTVRIENNKLKRKQGFIANDALVIDFQQTKSNYKANTQKLKEYKHKYQILQKTIKLAESLQHNALSQTAPL